jgi:hypothetical protein
VLSHLRRDKTAPKVGHPATFYSDVTRGAFQIYSLRWIGGNEQPDIFS